MKPTTTTGDFRAHAKDQFESIDFVANAGIDNTVIHSKRMQCLAPIWRGQPPFKRTAWNSA